MTRGLNATQVTESEKSYNSLITLVDILVDPNDPAYVTDFARDITVDGKDYLSAQGLISFSSVVEDAQNTINKVDFMLTGVPDEFVNLFLDYDYIDRQITIRKQFVNPDTDALIGGSFLVFDGRVDRPVISHEFSNRTASVSVSCSSHWSDFGRKNGRHTNDSEQQAQKQYGTYQSSFHASNTFSGDNCFKYAIDFDKEVKWGQTS